MKINIGYPVIVLRKNDNMIYVFFNDKDLKSTNEDLLKKINYRNVEIIDSNGLRYKITKAHKVRYLGLWGFNPFLKGGQILIDFEYDSHVQTIILEIFKDEIITRIEKKKKFWESGWDFEVLKQKIFACRSVTEMAILLK